MTTTARVTATALLAAMSIWAHHALSASYEMDHQITLKGTITKIDWSNPHARFYLDVPDSRGHKMNWDVELGSPNGLLRRGWTNVSLKRGDVVIVTGYRAKDGSSMASAVTIHFADGHALPLAVPGDAAK